jgi:hypothetical protein
MQYQIFQTTVSDFDFRISDLTVSICLDTNRVIVSQNEFKKFIAPITLSSQRPRPFNLFYRNLPWRSLRSLRETQSYPIFLQAKISKMFG